MPIFRHLARIGAAMLALSSGAAAEGQTNTRVQNTATLSYRSGGIERSVQSNTVALNVARGKQPTALSFRLLPIGYELAGLGCETSPSLLGIAAPIDAAVLAGAPRLASLDTAQALIMVLDAPGENLDPLTRESALIDVDAPRTRQQLRLTETAPDSGIFAGGVPALTQDPNASPCNIELKDGERIALSFAENDNSGSSEASALVDPAGYIFDSVTEIGRAHV